MRIFKTAILAGTCALVLAANAHATLITFDDINSGSTYVAIGNGYAGFNWNNLLAIDKNYVLGTGYEHGNVSPINSAFNGGGSPASFSGGIFTLNSAFFTGAWGPQSITVNGYLSGNLTHSSTFAVIDTAPTFESFNWSGIDTLTFSTSDSSQFVMDNLTVNAAPVPEPSTYLAGALLLLPFAASTVRRFGKNRRA